jgi:hypothetical protein
MALFDLKRVLLAGGLRRNCQSSVVLYDDRTGLAVHRCQFTVLHLAGHKGFVAV